MKTRWLALLMVLMLVVPMVVGVQAQESGPDEYVGTSAPYDPTAIPTEGIPIGLMANDTFSCPTIDIDGCIIYRADLTCDDGGWDWPDYNPAIPYSFGCAPIVDCYDPGGYSLTKTFMPDKWDTQRNYGKGSIKCVKGADAVVNQQGQWPLNYYAHITDVKVYVKWHQICVFNKYGWFCEYGGTGMINMNTYYTKHAWCNRQALPGTKHQVRQTIDYYEQLLENGVIKGYSQNGNGLAIMWRIEIKTDPRTLVPCTSM